MKSLFKIIKKFLVIKKIQYIFFLLVILIHGNAFSQPSYVKSNYNTTDQQEITVEFDEPDLSGEKPVLHVEGWNIQNIEVNI